LDTGTTKPIQSASKIIHRTILGCSSGSQKVQSIDLFLSISVCSASSGRPTSPLAHDAAHRQIMLSVQNNAENKGTALQTPDRCGTILDYNSCFSVECSGFGFLLCRELKLTE
jgi:hypothetical protein